MVIATRRTEPASSSRPPGKPSRRRRLSGEQLVFLALAGVVVALVFGNNLGDFNSDTRGDLYLDPGRVLLNSLTSWVPSPVQTGTPNFNTGFVPIAMVMWVIRTVGVPAWMAMRLWRTGLILLAAWGAVRLLREVSDGESTAVGRVAVAVAYVGNCFLIIGAASTQVLLPFALLPWLVITFARGVAAPRTWRWPAAFALVFFAMTGMQAGVVPLYLLSFLPAYILFARLVDGRAWRDLLGVLVRSGVLTLVVSLYWLIPALSASSSGAAIVAETEDPNLISLTTSYAENLRMLGQWPLYGRFGQVLFVPKGIGYLQNPLIVAATFCLPVLAAVGAWASRARGRLFAVLLLLVALPLMVGMFPPTNPSPSGRVLRAFLENVPGALAFRTTSKVSPVALLGLALLIGLGATALTPRLRRLRRWAQAALAGTAAVVVVAVTLPAWTGELFPAPFEAPRYWSEAADDLNETTRLERLLVVPGSDGARYRWTGRAPDDIFNLLFDKPVVSRLTVSQGVAYPANFLAALDVRLNTNRAQGPVTSIMSRYLGAGDVLARGDLRWEDIHATRPAMVLDQLRGDPGLQAAQTYGSAGENTARPPAANRDANAEARDAAVPPLQVFDVRDAVEMARVESAVGAYVIDGDNFAVPTMAQLGLLEGNPAYRLAGDMTTADLAEALRTGTRLAITDTNRRRLAGVHAVDDSYSITLPPEGPVRGQTATSTTLWPDRTDTQTVAELRGVAEIRATRAGAEFSLTPMGQATAAFDGDPQSAWIASAFGNAAGQGIHIELEQPTSVPRVEIDVAPKPPARGITAVRVAAGGWSAVVPVTPAGVAAVDLPPGVVSAIDITVVEAADRGTAGIAEIRLQGVQPRLFARMPSTVADLAAGLAPEDRARLATAPLDIVMQRQVSIATAPGRDEERVVNRIFDTPTDRSFTVTGALSSVDAVPNALAPAVADSVTTGRCVRIGTVDDRPLEVRFRAASPTEAARGARIEACGGPLELRAGEHQLWTDPGWPVDTLRLQATGAAALATEPPPEARILGRSNTQLDIEATGTSPYYLVTGNAYDARWTATIDGRPLGAPTVIDGYSTGWRIDRPGTHRINVRFGPQRAMNIGLVASAAGVGFCAVLVLWPRRRRLPWWPTPARRAAVTP